jgi:hypothetical protein
LTTGTNEAFAISGKNFFRPPLPGLVDRSLAKPYEFFGLPSFISGAIIHLSFCSIKLKKPFSEEQELDVIGTPAGRILPGVEEKRAGIVGKWQRQDGRNSTRGRRKVSLLARETGDSIKPRVSTLGQLIGRCSEPAKRVIDMKRQGYCPFHWSEVLSDSLLSL